MKTKHLVALLYTILVALTMSAQQKELTLEDLNFGGNNYRNMVPQNRNCTWWGDQLVRRDKEACYLVSKQSGKETLLFTLDDINKCLGEGARVVSLSNVALPYTDRSVASVNTGKALLDIDFKKMQIVSSYDVVEGESVLMHNRLSGAVAYLQNDNLWVSVNGKKHQLSTDGSSSIVYGQSVHRNEFGIDGGVFFSNRGTKMAFYRMDQSMVADYPQVTIPEIDFDRSDPSKWSIATPAPDKYPMAGKTSHKVTVGVHDMATGKTVYLDAGDPTDRYFTNITWSPDDKTLYMFELNRDQNDCRLVAYDTTTGSRLGELYRETDEKYVEPQHPLYFLPWDDAKCVMLSQKDGYCHMYLCTISTDGGKPRFDILKQLTSGAWLVMDIIGFDAKHKSIVYASNEQSPIQRNIFSVSTVNGKRTLIDCNGLGWHNATLSKSGQYLFDSYSTPDTPRNIAIVNGATGKKTLYFSAEDPWKGYDVPQYTSGTIKAADGTTDLYWRMVKPSNFDASKKYPTIIYVYGGPHAHNVDASWHYRSRGWETYMAQRGYILFILDNRGSENRGKAFEQATFRQLGQEEMLDQMKGVEYLKSLSYVDADRIGVHGWSFGGFMTISLMTNYPDVFKVGVAGGPVIDWHWYEVMYGERYMDTPQSNPEGYSKTSLLSKAKNLKGKLQIITGYNDPVVVPQHCLSFLKACIEAGTQPDFFAYPGQPHNMMGHQSTHLHERISQYFFDYLK